MKKGLFKKCIKLLAISTLLMQNLQPIAVLAERRIIIYENQVGPYYQVDTTDSEITYTPEPEEENNIVVEETQETETVDHQEEDSLEIPVATVEPELEIESENTEVPTVTEMPILTDEPIELEGTSETPVDENIIEPTSTPEVVVEPTLEPVIDEKIEIIETPEEMETTPIEFKEIASEFIVQAEEGFTFEQAIDEYTSVYVSTEDDGLKQLVIGENPINAKVDQSFEPISLALDEVEVSTYSFRNNTAWTNTSNTIQSVYPVNPEDGITLTVKDKSVIIKSTLTSAGVPVQQDNQIIYPMEGNVNLRYIIQPGLICEDIMIYSSDASSSYEYEVLFEHGRIASSDNVIAVIDENEELLMYITAPVAYDAAGAETEVTLTYEDGIMSVSIDEEWMKSEERLYPIVIDPEYSYSNISYNSSMGIDVSVGANLPVTTMGALDMANYNYILPSGLINHAFLYLGNTSVLTDAHSFYKLKLDHESLSSVLAGKYIKEAYLRLSTGEDGNISKNNTIITKLVMSNFNILQAKYSSMPQGLRVISETPIEAGNWKSYDIDITEYLRWYYTLGNQNNAVQMQLKDQSGSATFHSYEYVCYDQKGWYTPSTTVTYFDGDVSVMTDVNDFTYNIRPFTVSSYEEGILTFNSLGIDGEAPVGSTVNITMSADGQTVSSQSVAVTEEIICYPEYTAVTGVQNYNSTKTSNYQSTVMSGFETGKLYTISIQATDGTTTSAMKTETFQLVEVKSFDMISSIAQYYGVNESQLMTDNNMTDGLVISGNLIIVRNPQSNAGEEYVVDDLSADVEKQVIAALAGRDLTCEYGLIPVNLNTGSFLLESNDFSFNVFADEFKFTRTYNSSAAEVPGDFGYGWSYSGNYAVAKGNGGATVLLEDGTRYYFELDETTGKYSCDLTIKYKLEYDTDHFVLKTQNKTIVFNPKGKVSSIIDHHGNTTSYTYNGLQLNTITLPDGKVMTFTYTSGVITKVTMEDETYVSYEYDAKKDLISFTDQTNVTIHYKYNDTHDMTSWYYVSDKKIVENTYENHQLTQQIDGTGSTTTIEYYDEYTQITDGNENVQKVYKDGNSWTKKLEYPDGNVELKNYVNGLLMSETKENGVSYTYTYDSELYGVLKTSTRNDGYQIVYGYDTNANLTSETHKNAAGTVLLTRSFTYDEHNNLVTKTDADGNTTEYTYNSKHQILTETDPLNRVTRYEYNEYWKVSKKINPDGTYRTYTYNDEGYLLTETDEFEKTTTYELSPRNQIIKITYPDGGTVKYEHDAAGNVETEINQLGGITTYEYDTNNSLRKKTVDYRNSKDDATALSAVTTYSYDDNQNVIEIRELAGIKESDEKDHITKYTYDSRNRILTETINDVLQVTYAYNKYGIETVTNSRGKVKTNTYDTLGRLIQITDFDGLTIKYTYDLLGRVLNETDKHGVTTTYEYNGEGQVTKITTPRSVTINTYDNAGQLTKKEVTTDNITRKWEYEYDSMGNLIKEKDAEDNEITYVYQSNRLMSKRDQFIDLNEEGTLQQCREILYTYDNNGNLASETRRLSVLSINADGVTVSSYSDEVTTGWTYDKAGNTISETDGKGHTTSYAYNVRGDLIKMVEAAPEDEIAPVTLYEVNHKGQTVKVEHPEIVHDDETTVTIVTEYVYNPDGTLKEEVLSGKTIKSYVYDDYRNLTSETHLGVTTSYTYDDLNRMIKKRDASELITHYEYDVYSQLIKVSIDNFSTTSDLTDTVLWEAYAYDEYGQVIRESDRYGMSKYYLYNNDGTVNSMKYAPSPSTSSEPVFADVSASVYEHYTYDDLGRLTEKTDQSNNIWSYDYDASGNLTSEIVNDHEKTYEYNLFDKMVKETNSLGQITTWKYDNAGNLEAEIDNEGRAHLYSYTDNDLLKSEYTAESYLNYLEGTETAKRVVAYEYYANGSVKKQIDGEGFVEQFKYNVYGNVSESIDKKGYQTSYDYYDNNLNVKTETKYLNNAKTISIINSYTYTDLNQLETSKDGENNVTTYTYDIFGNVDSIKDAENFTETYTYNTLNQLWKTYDKNNRYTIYSYYTGNLVKSVKGWDTGTTYAYDSLYRLDKATDMRNNSTSYDYDSLGNLSSVIDALNQVIEYTYDGENQLETMTQPNNTVTTYERDSHGNIIKTTVSNTTTSRVSAAEYDSRGNVVKEVNGAGNVTLYEYNKNNQLSKKSVALNENSVPVVIVAYTYDGYGNLLTETDGEDNMTSHEYDEAEFKKQTTDPEGNLTTYTYDKAGNLKSVQDAKGYITTYTPNGVGNVEKQTSNANQKEISYSYNGYGQVTKVTDTDGESETFMYDEYGNLTRHVQKDNTVITRTYDVNFNLLSEGTSDFTYDALNRLSTVSENDVVSTVFTYDVLGNIATVTRGTEVISYQYNAYGEKCKVTYPDGSEQTYAYDGAGRISSTTANGIIVTYSYDALGNILTETYSNGLLVTKTYDAAGNLKTQKTEKNGTVLSQYSYDYNGNNSLVSETRIVDGVTTTVTHDYDERDELKQTVSTVNNVTTTINYTYSLVGNKAAVVNGTSTQSFTYNDLNQLTQMTDSEGTVSYQYDARGNRISESKGLNNTKTYSYDTMNRLISVTDYDGTVITYSYDGLGNRVSESITSDGETTNITYMNDFTQEYVEVLSKISGTAEENYYYAEHRISSDDTIYSYDGLDNVNMTLSSAGSILKKYEYSDYGERNLDSKTEILDNEYGYNGEAHTVDGLQYLRARYYDPVTGVFISADSYRGEFSHPLSQNRYTYAHNNPIKYDDPSGHWPPPIGLNKNVTNINMDGGGSGSSTLKQSQQQPVTGQQNTNYTGGTLLKNVGTLPSVKTEAVIFDEGDITVATKEKTGITVSAEEETEVTGKQESDSVGTVTTIVTETNDNTQPYGVETYDTPETETKATDVKDMAKGILSGIVMAGIGMLIAGAFALTTIATPVAAVATAVITGFAGAYVNAGVGALVENKSLEEYGRSQGYKTLKDYHGKLLKDAFIGAAIAGTTAVVATAVLYGSSLIGNSVSDDVAKAVANQSDEAIVSVTQKADDLAQMSDDITVVKDKMNEIPSNVINEDDFIPVSEQRVSHRQSELEFYEQNPSLKQQRSFIDGSPEDYGVKGTIRVDAYDEMNNVAYEVKNYDLSSSKGRSSLVSNVKKQVSQRMNHLPEGAKQVIVLDIRGQQVTYKTMQEITTKMAMNNPDAGLSFMLMRY